MDSDFINVSYKLEAQLRHEGAFGQKADVPSLFFPIIVTRDAKGAIDSGKAGTVVTSMLS